MKSFVEVLGAMVAGVVVFGEHGARAGCRRERKARWRRLTAAPAAAPTGPPLQLRSLDSVTQADPFPAVNPKNFTADYALGGDGGQLTCTRCWGMTPDRIWRVVGIQKTAVAAGVSKVTALVSEKAPKAKVLTAMFYVMPDGKAPDRAGCVGAEHRSGRTRLRRSALMLQARADGPARGGSIERICCWWSSRICNARTVRMRRRPWRSWRQDFPKARIVYENFPLTEVHPFALQAAEYGDCVAKQSNPAFFTYAQAVYDTQAGLDGRGRACRR